MGRGPHLDLCFDALMILLDPNSSSFFLFYLMLTTYSPRGRRWGINEKRLCEHSVGGVSISVIKDSSDFQGNDIPIE